MIDPSIFKTVIKYILALGGFLAIFWTGKTYKTQQLSEKLSDVEQKNTILQDSITWYKKQLSIIDNNNLIVYNNSQKERTFHYFNIVEGHGTGMPIKPYKFKQFELKKGAYRWYYNDRDDSKTRTDTLEKGNFVYQKYNRRKVVVMN